MPAHAKTPLSQGSAARDTDAGTDADVDTDADPDGAWLIVQDISKHPRRLFFIAMIASPDSGCRKSLSRRRLSDLYHSWNGSVRPAVTAGTCPKVDLQMIVTIPARHGIGHGVEPPE
uniref:Uncharacterized protein n=1 Tax=Coccidioides posadasii RMSCC 3488 TaxID=454284 RepID=A0A0J6FG75_COCPO|nr:hypothetical protein CPAG_08420 [Coccidioides posadasii RMSCC 3488]